jgi:uncharacterized protein (TIGR02246 family)
MGTEAGTKLSVEDLGAIEALHEQWVANERAGNAKAVLDLCDEDVLWLPPGGRPMRGKQAILHWLSSPAAPIQELRLSNLEIAGDGRVAWKTCEFVTTWQPPNAHPPITERGSHLWVLHKTDAGHWRVVVATWTLL